MNKTNRQYLVTAVTKESADTKTIWLTNQDGTVPTYTAGQFINVFFPDSGTPEGKAYSISSAPGAKNFSLTVKEIGDFSGRLCSLQVGDLVTGSDPYGFFYPETTDLPLVMIAGGIGITPFYSIINNLKTTNTVRPVTLLHSVKTSDDRIFFEQLKELKKSLPKLEIKYFITQEKIVSTENKLARRLQAEDLRALTKIETEFLICGSISFTRDVWRLLKELGVAEDFIYTEAFFSH